MDGSDHTINVNINGNTSTPCNFSLSYTLEEITRVYLPRFIVISSVSCGQYSSVMASITPTTAHLVFASKPLNSSSSSKKLNSRFWGTQNDLRCFRPFKIGPTNVYRAKCFFKFGKSGVDAEGAGIYGSQSRDDFERDDVEQYFNYMGMLAVEGSYDKMEALLNQNIHPVDILLMLAASEGDKPKLEELLRAGATYDVKDADGRTAIDRAASQEIKDFILGFSTQKA